MSRRSYPPSLDSQDVGAIVSTPFGLGKIKSTCRKDSGRGFLLFEVTILSLSQEVYLSARQLKKL